MAGLRRLGAEVDEGGGRGLRDVGVHGVAGRGEEVVPAPEHPVRRGGPAVAGEGRGGAGAGSWGRHGRVVAPAPDGAAVDARGVRAHAPARLIPPTRARRRVGPDSDRSDRRSLFPSWVAMAARRRLGYNSRAAGPAG